MREPVQVQIAVMKSPALKSLALKGLIALGGLIAVVSAVGILGAPILMSMAMNG